MSESVNSSTANKPVVPVAVGVLLYLATFAIGPLTPWKLTGLPTHILVIHAAVVGIPALALASLILTWKDAWRQRTSGWLAFAGIAVLAATNLATESGEKFREAMFANGDDSKVINEHAEWADRLHLLMMLFALVLLAHFILQLLAPALYAKLSAVAKVVVTVLAIASIGLTVVTGHLGSKAVWGDRIQHTFGDGTKFPASSVPFSSTDSGH